MRFSKKNMMRIMHASVEIANQMGVISKAQRELGYNSISVAYSEDWLSYNCDINLKLNRYSTINKYMQMLNFISKYIAYYDIYHFHFGKSLLPRNMDLPLLKALNKKILFQFHGCDIRNKNMAIRHQINPCNNCMKTCNINKKFIKLSKIDKYANKIFVTTPDLIEYVPSGRYIPVAIDLKEWQLNKQEEYRSFTTIIMHAPSNREIKGTEYIIHAVKKLKEEGFNVELKLVEKIPHNLVKEYYRQADIVVDQLLIGWYGLFSVEAMALGKPVLCFIRDDLKKYQESLPIMSTTTASLYENLKLLIKDVELRKEMGDKGRKYVEEVHDSKKIAKELIKIYENLL